MKRTLSIAVIAIGITLVMLSSLLPHCHDISEGCLSTTHCHDEYESTEHPPSTLPTHDHSPHSDKLCQGLQQATLTKTNETKRMVADHYARIIQTLQAFISDFVTICDPPERLRLWASTYCYPTFLSFAPDCFGLRAPPRY